LHAIHQHGANHAAPSDETYYVTCFHEKRLSKINQCLTDFAPARLAGEGARRTGLGQPLMVVVLVEVASAATPALEAGAVFKKEGAA
jgi:hypothetical protein